MRMKMKMKMKVVENWGCLTGEEWGCFGKICLNSTFFRKKWGELHMIEVFLVS